MHGNGRGVTEMLDKEEMVVERDFGSAAAMRRGSQHLPYSFPREPERSARSVRDSEGSEGGLIGRDELREKVMGTGRLSGESRGVVSEERREGVRWSEDRRKEGARWSEDERQVDAGWLENERRDGSGWREDKEPWYGGGSPRSL